MAYGSRLPRVVRLAALGLLVLSLLTPPWVAYPASRAPCLSLSGGLCTGGSYAGAIVTLPFGGTSSDLSATGGTGQILKQDSLGAPITVGTLAAAALSNGVTGSGAVMLAVAPTSTGLMTVGTLKVGATAAQSTALISARIANNAFEFGHTNSAGYGSTIGAESGSGAPFLAFNAEHGTNASTYKTRGIAGVILKSDNAGALLLGIAATASADNQSFTEYARLTATGRFGVGINPSAQMHVYKAITTPSGNTWVGEADGLVTLTTNNANSHWGWYNTMTINQAGFDLTGTPGARGIEALAVASGATGTVTQIHAVRGNVQNTGAGVLTEGVSFYASGANSGGGTFTTWTNFEAPNAAIATNVYGFRGRVSSNATRWNFYADGSAQNWFSGFVGIGSGKSAPGVALDIAGAVSTTGAMTFTDLATTGAATGKTMVCADTNGKLYRSTSATNCLN